MNLFNFGDSFPSDLNDPMFWHANSRFQQSGHWLRHSIAIRNLNSPSGIMEAVENYGATCGPIAFAASMGISALEALDYFPMLQFKPWTNRRDMESALSKAGNHYERMPEMWPTAGLCIIQFTGPWTKRNFAQAALHHTHWIAVLGEYVFDINWQGWLPRKNWEELILEELIASKRSADGWKILTGYNIQRERY